MRLPLEKGFTMRRIGLVIVLLAGSACEKLTQSELVGTYVGTQPPITETILLCPDGGFTQQVVRGPGVTALTSEGAWEFDGKYDQLVLDDKYIVAIDGFGRPKKHPDMGTAVLPVERFLGQIKIGNDQVIEYIKK